MEQGTRTSVPNGPRLPLSTNRTQSSLHTKPQWLNHLLASALILFFILAWKAVGGSFSCQLQPIPTNYSHACQLAVLCQLWSTGINYTYSCQTLEPPSGGEGGSSGALSACLWLPWAAPSFYGSSLPHPVTFPYVIICQQLILELSIVSHIITKDIIDKGKIR